MGKRLPFFTLQTPVELCSIAVQRAIKHSLGRLRMGDFPHPTSQTAVEHSLFGGLSELRRSREHLQAALTGVRMTDFFPTLPQTPAKLCSTAVRRAFPGLAMPYKEIKTSLPVSPRNREVTFWAEMAILRSDEAAGEPPWPWHVQLPPPSEAFGCV